MIRRGQPKVSVRVETRRIKEMTVGQLLAFADELREASAPPTTRVYFDRDTHLGEQMRCSWSEGPAAPPEYIVHGGASAEPKEFARLREAAGLTQQAVADAVGLSRSSVANLETGRQDMPLSKLQAYAEAVGARLVLAHDAAAEEGR